MPKSTNALLSFLVILALAACTTEPHKSDSSSPMSAAEFRRMFPLDARHTDAIVADYARVQASLIQASAGGASAFVVLLTAGGDVHGGVDVFYSNDPPRIKELRDNYAAIQVGKTICWQDRGNKVSCKEGEPLHLGLPELPMDHIAKIWSRDIRCVSPDEPCRFIKVQLGSAESDTNAMDGYTADPDLVGHDYELVFRLKDDHPVYFKQTDHYHVGITATGFYTYKFGELVEGVTLPTEGGSIDGFNPAE